jgi:hypothetical protein
MLKPIVGASEGPCEITRIYDENRASDASLDNRQTYRDHTRHLVVMWFINLACMLIFNWNTSHFIQIKNTLGSHCICWKEHVTILSLSFSLSLSLKSKCLVQTWRSLPMPHPTHPQPYKSVIRFLIQYVVCVEITVGINLESINCHCTRARSVYDVCIILCLSLSSIYMQP